MTVILAVPEVAHRMALLPPLWLAWLRFRGKRLDVAWWWLAGTFIVSWIADSVAHFADAPLMSMVYPVSQAVIVAVVFLDRRSALKIILALVLVGVFDVFWKGIGSPDVLLRTVAWLSIVGIAYPLKQLGKLRASLLVSFGVGWFCWMIYAIDPGWPSWGVYQLTRLAGMLLFCWAATRPLPRFTVLRPSL